MKVYTAGPLLHCSEVEALGWRREVKALLGSENVCDPSDRKWVQQEEYLTDAECRDLVDGDLNQIDRCEVVLWNCWKGSIGSSMEAMYAHLTHKPLVVVCPRPDSAWVRRFADYLTDSVSDACLTIACSYDLDVPIRKKR